MNMWDQASQTHRVAQTHTSPGLLQLKGWEVEMVRFAKLRKAERRNKCDFANHQMGAQYEASWPIGISGKLDLLKICTNVQNMLILSLSFYFHSPPMGRLRPIFQSIKRTASNPLALWKCKSIVTQIFMKPERFAYNSAISCTCFL